MDLKEIKSILEKNKEGLKHRFKIKNLGIFGSYVRGEQRAGSDLDILIEFEEQARLSLLDVAGIEIELSDLLGLKVDLVEKKNLKPYIGQEILKEVVYV